MTEKIVRYWSRRPGHFIDPQTGHPTGAFLSFSGTVREWYDTLIEDIFSLHRISGFEKSYVHVPTNLLPILQSSISFRPYFDSNILIPNNEDFNSSIVGLINGEHKVIHDDSLSSNEIILSDAGSWKNRSKIIVLHA